MLAVRALDECDSLHPRLSDASFDEIIGHSVPIDMRVLPSLGRSPLALDVYAWCAYRIYTLARSRNPTALVSRS